MMQLSPRFVVFLFLTAVLFVARTESSENEFPITDTVFTEIVLSDDGVVAFDSLGNRWEYDFESAVFVLSHGDAQQGRSEDQSGEEEIILPVEARCTEERHLSDIQKSVLLGYDEFTNDPVIAYGKVTIKGWAKGNVQSLSKSVLVTESGQVEGDIRAPQIVVKEGGKVFGERILTDPAFDVDMLKDQFTSAGMWVVFGFAIFFLFSGFIAVSLMPLQAKTVHSCIATNRVKSFLLGMLFVILLPMLATLLGVTIVGLILVPLLPLAYLFAWVLAMIYVGGNIDTIVFRRFLNGERSLMFHAMTGIFGYLALWTVVAVLLGSNDEVSQGFGIFFLVVAILASAYGLCLGTGAAILTRFGFRDYVNFGKSGAGAEEGAPAPAPPPIPDYPGVTTPPDQNPSDGTGS